MADNLFKTTTFITEGVCINVYRVAPGTESLQKCLGILENCNF